MMKPIVIITALLSAATLPAAEVEQGDSLSEVRSTLGSPRGQVRVGDRHLLYYERGEIELAQDRVTRVALLSPEEHAAITAREAQRSEERAARRQQLIAEGEALRDRKLADAVFARSPASYQVAFWEDFTRRYPDVSVVEPLTIARLSLQEKRDTERKQEEAANRVAELEARLADSEERREFYPLATYGGYYRPRHYRPFNMGQVEYHFFSSPLPPYTTPSGNPAGNLSGPIINLPSGNPALPRANEDRTDDRRAPDRDGDDHRHRRGRM